MSTPIRRSQQQRSDEMRARLIDATIECMRRGGYNAATTRNVAAQAAVSLGALAHHFPSRTALVAAAIDEVGQRCVEQSGQGAHDIPAGDPRRTVELLDAAWAIHSSDLFVVWIKVWSAAAEDAELYAALSPVEKRLTRTIMRTLTEVVPPSLPPERWKPLSSLVLAAMRGEAFARALEPRFASTPDRWPIVRAELLRLLGAGGAMTTTPPR